MLGPDMLVPESISGIPGCLNVGCFAEVQMPANPKDAASRSNHSRKATLCIFGATDGCVYVMGGCAGGKVTSAKIVDVCPLESPTIALEKRNAASMNPTTTSGIVSAGGGGEYSNTGMKMSTSQKELNSTTTASILSKTGDTTTSESASSPTTCAMDDLLHDVDNAENIKGAWMMQSVVAFRLSREDVGVIVGYVPSPTSGEQLLNEYHINSNKSKEKEMVAEYASTLVFYTVKPFDALAVAPEERSLRTTAPTAITNEHLSTRRTVQVKQLVLSHVHLTRLFCIHSESGPFIQVSTDATEPPPHLTLMYSGLDVRNESHDFKCLGWPGKANKRRGRKQESKMPPMYDPLEGSVLQTLMSSGAADVPLCSLHYICFMVDIAKGRANKNTGGAGSSTGGSGTRLKELLVAGCVDGRVLLAISGDAHGPRLLVHCSGPVSDVKFFFPSTRRQRQRDKVDFLDDLLDRERRKSVKAASAALRRRGSTLSSEADSFDFVSEPGDCETDVSEETDQNASPDTLPAADGSPILSGNPKPPVSELAGLNGSTSQTSLCGRELSSGSISSGSPNHSSTNTRMPDHRVAVQESSSLSDLIIAVADSAGAVFTFEHFTGELDQMVSTTVLDVEECPGEDPAAMGVGTNSQQFAASTYESKPSALEPSVVFSPTAEAQVLTTSLNATTPGKSVASKWFSSRGKPAVLKEKELGNSVCFGASVESIQDLDADDLITPQRKGSSVNIESLRGSGTAGGGGSRQNSATATQVESSSGTPLNQTHPPPTSAQRQKQLNYASSAVWTGTVIARGPTAIAICDVDHDGINELIVTTFGRTVAYCKRRPLVMQDTHKALTGVGDDVVPYGGSTSSFHRDLAIRSNMGSFVAASDKPTVIISSLPSIPSDDDDQGCLSPTIRSECAQIAMPSQYAVAFVSEVYCQMYGAAAVDFHACGLRSLVFSGPEQIAVQQLISRNDVVEKVIHRLHIVQRLLGITSNGPEGEEPDSESMDDVSSPSCTSGTAVLET